MLEGSLPLSSRVEHIYMPKEKTTIYPVTEARILELHQSFLLILYVQSISGVRKGRILIHTGGPGHCIFCWPISIETQNLSRLKNENWVESCFHLLLTWCSSKKEVLKTTKVDRVKWKTIHTLLGKELTLNRSHCLKVSGLVRGKFNTSNNYSSVYGLTINKC